MVKEYVQKHHQQVVELGFEQGLSGTAPQVSPSQDNEQSGQGHDNNYILQS